RGDQPLGQGSGSAHPRRRVGSEGNVAHPGGGDEARPLRPPEPLHGADQGGLRLARRPRRAGHLAPRGFGRQEWSATSDPEVMPLPGPSRTIIVEPVKRPERAPAPDPHRQPARPPEPAEKPAPGREREKEPARSG